MMRIHHTRIHPQDLWKSLWKARRLTAQTAAAHAVEADCTDQAALPPLWKGEARPAPRL
jgi:hypothetical protein